MLTRELCRRLDLSPSLTEASLERQRAALLEVASHDAEVLRDVSVRYPLATWSPWTHPTAPDQGSAVRLAAAVSLATVLGGNRSGKSEGMRALAVAIMLGADHPMVRAWRERVGIPDGVLPRGPGVVHFVAQSMGASRAHMRPAVNRMLPKGAATWHGFNALAECFVRVSVPGYSEPGVGLFKSVDQTHESFKGSEGHYYIDEEPEGTEGRRVFEECLRGASSVGGRVFIAATPQSGQTWMTRELVDKGAYGARSIRLNALHNTMVPDYGRLVQWLRSIDDPDEKRMRILGIPVDRRGRVYPEWTRGDGDRWGMGHVCEPFDVPAGWPRFIGVDWGQTAPTAIVWGALGDDDVLYVYRSWESPRVPYSEWARRVHEAMGGRKGEAGWVDHTEWPEMMFADPASPAAIRTFQAAELPVTGAVNDVQPGVSAVRDRLRRGDDGRPRLKVFSTCSPLIASMEAYRLNERLKVAAPLKVNDHSADALRYMAIGVQRWRGE